MSTASTTAAIASPAVCPNTMHKATVMVPMTNADFAQVVGRAPTDS